MRLSSKSLFFALLLLVFMGTGCEIDEEESDYYNFQVISHGGVVSGYYIVDGGSHEEFTTSLESTSALYSFRKNLSSPTSIRIVTESSTTITSVEIYVYQNSKEVDYTEDSITVDGDTVYATLYYEFTSTDSESE